MTHPRNVAVSTNDTSVFTCTTDSTSPPPSVLITWTYIAAGSTALPSKAIVSLCNVDNAYKSVYHTESAAGVCNLTVNSTQLTNAGTYLCQDNQDSTYSTAELVVLGNFIIALSLCSSDRLSTFGLIWHKILTIRVDSKIRLRLYTVSQKRKTLNSWL